MEANEQTMSEQVNKVALGSKVDPSIAQAVEAIAAEEERTVSNTVERLLKESPRVAERLVATV